MIRLRGKQTTSFTPEPQDPADPTGKAWKTGIAQGDRVIDGYVDPAGHARLLVGSSSGVRLERRATNGASISPPTSLTPLVPQGHSVLNAAGDSQGRTWISSYRTVPQGTVFALTRLDTNDVRDTTFGTNGSAIFTKQLAVEGFARLQLQPDAAVVGSARSNVTVYQRYR